jgi:hypothetical protein
VNIVASSDVVIEKFHKLVAQRILRPQAERVIDAVIYAERLDDASIIPTLLASTMSSGVGYQTGTDIPANGVCT